MRFTRLRSLFPAALIGLIGFAGSATAQVAPKYVLTDLGTLIGGTNSRAEGISPNGTVVGYSEIAGGLHRAVAWTGPGFTANNLGVLAGDTQSEARAMNAAGTIVGFSTDSGFNADKAATFTVGGSPVNLGIGAAITQPAVGPTLTNSRAEAISPTGEIVGHAYSGNFNALTAADGIRGFYRNAAGTAVTRLDPPNGTTLYPLDGVLAYGINASGQVFGQADPGNGFRGSRWGAPSGSAAVPSFTYPTAAGGNPALTEYLGTQGNNVSRIVGTATDAAATVSQAFASDGSTTTLLNTLGGNLGNAYSINNALFNVIVGSSSTAAGGLHAAAWNWSGANPNPTAIDLNGLLQSNPTGMTLIEAFGINDNGLIVGYGTVGGADHAFVLTPAAVPEPGTLALCGLGLGGLAVRTWRRRRS
jgi:probable HAF family extracellular repeat protein